VGRRVHWPKKCYKENEEKKYWAAKLTKFTKRVKVKALGAFGETQKGNLMGVTKHFVQEKSDSKQVKLGTESNDVGLAADPKYPIS
jgi:NADH:ubiquinone oxidoreductase subunit F (NADH-binding)